MRRCCRCTPTASVRWHRTCSPFQYWRSDQIRGIRGRIFNTTGPRKRDDVVSDFAGRVARIRREGGKLRVGHIETHRAILDVRDTVEALVRLAAAGASGEAYNICADTAYTISEFIRILEELTNQAFEVASYCATAGLGLRVPGDSTVELGHPSNPARSQRAVAGTQH